MIARPQDVGRLCESAKAHPATTADSQSRPTIGKPFPKRLRRLDTVHTAGQPVFFLTFCTARRMRLLADAETHARFLAFCQRSAELANAWVGRYVLMPDHIHVFVGVESSSVLSRWAGSVKKFLAVHWREQGHAAPFWQEGFFDHLLRSNESYEEKWEYVRQNPVRAGLTNTAEEWPFAGEVQTLELSEWQGRCADSVGRLYESAKAHHATAADSQSRPTTAKQKH